MDNKKQYNAPPIDLLSDYERCYNVDEETINRITTVIKHTIKEFVGCELEIVNTVNGLRITIIEAKIPEYVPLKKFFKCKDDIRLRLELFDDIRIYPDIKKQVIVFEIPNGLKNVLSLKKIVESEEFKNDGNNKLSVAIGENVYGKNVVADISKMPHLFIGGATGTGKSVSLYSIIVSLLYKYSPSELRFILVDPKMVEFCAFEGLPHLYTNKIICNSKETISMLNWAVNEMERRYKLFFNDINKPCNIDEYNNSCKNAKDKLPKIVIIIDEISDLLISNKNEIEGCIMRLISKARAAGIYLIFASQRSLSLKFSIMTNTHARLEFKTVINVDSRLLVGDDDCCCLLGKGDCLYKSPFTDVIERVQSPYLDFKDVISVINYIKANNESVFFDFNVNN